PNVDCPTPNVGAGVPGGDPGTLASAVAGPPERQFTTIAGLDEMTSSSSTGSTNVTLQFDMSRDVDSAAVDVQTAIAAVMPLLPAGMPAPPSFRKFNPADQPIMFLSTFRRDSSSARTLLDAVPIALGLGAGGGLLVSQFITLYLTPVVYTYMAQLIKTRGIPATL